MFCWIKTKLDNSKFSCKMGNVSASAKSLQNSAATTPSGLPELSKDLEASSDTNKSQNDEDRGNPGTMEELHKKCKDVMPTNFEGAKFMIQKGISYHFQVTHTLNLCTSNSSGYRFGAIYVGTKQLSPSELYPVILGDIDPSGNVNANIIHQVTPKLRCKFASQIQNSKVTAAQLTTDYKGNDYTASLTVANPNVINESGVLVGHYLQAVSKNLALGAELAYQYGPAVPGGQMAIVSAAARYVNGLATWSGTAGVSGLHLCYYRKSSEQLQFGVEVDTNFRVQEAVGTLGYQIDLPKADVVFRGMIDTNWNVAAVMEKKLQPLNFTLALSGILNHTKNQFKLGVGLIIGG
ncbi:Mitochondrial import receptor subunit TOM40 like 1 [Pseudolycoriella hygida]|uniref:Mitochondrial import receptor subunit TOM40 like 1 n=1 Tax=Pseudolycoriella hygida TaxID=35572 RepID=A0A9Q0N2L1_9DIPT|nr:Mitochondrial import receptor subunit TOM40 like 1 [Pseudolycoriella hygida]